MRLRGGLSDVAGRGRIKAKTAPLHKPQGMRHPKLSANEGLPPAGPSSRYQSVGGLQEVAPADFSSWPDWVWNGVHAVRRAWQRTVSYPERWRLWKRFQRIASLLSPDEQCQGETLALDASLLRSSAQASAGTKILPLAKTGISFCIFSDHVQSRPLSINQMSSSAAGIGACPVNGLYSSSNSTCPRQSLRAQRLVFCRASTQQPIHHPRGLNSRGTAGASIQMLPVGMFFGRLGGRLAHQRRANANPASAISKPNTTMMPRLMRLISCRRFAARPVLIACTSVWRMTKSDDTTAAVNVNWICLFLQWKLQFGVPHPSRRWQRVRAFGFSP
jgi:hypothetical protein